MLANAFLKCAAARSPAGTRQLAHPRDLVSCGQKWLAASHPFFTAREREQAGCQHRLFFSQVEFCDNLIFRRRAALDKLGERLLDANRTIGQPNKITVIFGRKVTKQYRGKLQTEIEDMNLPNPVIRSHYRNGFIKQYVRDHLILRTEAASNNVNDYGVNKAVENLPRCVRQSLGDQRQLPQRPARHLGDLRRSRPVAKARGADHHADRKAHSGPQARSPSATRPDARARTLRAHRGRQYLHHCRNLPAVIDGARLRPRTLHARLAPLRPLKTPCQRSCRQAPRSRRYRFLPQGYSICLDLSEALRTRLCSTDGCSPPSYSRRPSSTQPQALAARPPLPASYRRPRPSLASRRPCLLPTRQREQNPR